MKLDLNFQRGEGRVLEKIPSVVGCRYFLNYTIVRILLQKSLYFMNKILHFLHVDVHSEVSTL